MGSLGAQRTDGVSVVLATYNGARYLRKQLDSILSQTRPPDEIVVADDGSTDPTLDLALGVLADSEIPHRVERNPVNLGYGENFLAAAATTSRRWIAFSDQDDVWHPRKLELSVAALVTDDSCLAVHPMRHIDAAGRVIGDQSQEIRGRGVLPALQGEPFGVYFGLTMTFDARLLDLIPSSDRGVDTHGFSAKLAHDRWVYFLATNFGRTSLVPDRLVDYRQHTSQSFGAGHVGLRQRFSNKVAEGAPRLQQQADAARARAHLVEAHAPRGGASVPDTAGWRAVADRYHRVADMYQRRAALYREPSLVPRASSVIDLARSHAYRGVRDGGLGFKRVLEDVAVGVLRLG